MDADRHESHAPKRHAEHDHAGRLSSSPRCNRTLVASARHDPIAPPVLGKDLATRIGGARYVEFDSASHALPIQLADEVNALLADHLCSAEQSGAPATLS